MIDVSGKWALITGASRGIGRLIALEMAKQGCNLVLHSRRLSHCSSLLEQVQRLGVQAYAVEAELSDLDAVEDMMTRIDRTGTSLDIVFNNAGVQVAYRSAFLETPSEDYIKSFAINTICSHADLLSCAAGHGGSEIWKNYQYHQWYCPGSAAGRLFRKQGGTG